MLRKDDRYILIDFKYKYRRDIMIDENLIIINKIEPVYECKTIAGEEPTMKQIALKVGFTYKKMNADMELKTNNIYGNEIKDLIIEQLR